MNQFLNQPFLPNLLAGVDEPDPDPVFVPLADHVAILEQCYDQRNTIDSQIKMLHDQNQIIRNLEKALQRAEAGIRQGGLDLMGQPYDPNASGQPYPYRVVVDRSLTTSGSGHSNWPGNPPPPGQPPKYDTHIVLCQQENSVFKGQSGNWGQNEASQIKSMWELYLKDEEDIRALKESPRFTVILPKA